MPDSLAMIDLKGPVWQAGLEPSFLSKSKRQYYLSKSAFTGGQALNQCATGLPLCVLRRPDRSHRLLHSMAPPAGSTRILKRTIDAGGAPLRKSDRRRRAGL